MNTDKFLPSRAVMREKCRPIYADYEGLGAGLSHAPEPLLMQLNFEPHSICFEGAKLRPIIRVPRLN